MKQDHYHIMETFNIRNIPTLDICVLGALELFMQTPLPKISIPYKHPLIIGSGNAEATGKILFEEKDALFANESNFEQKIQRIPSIDGIILISASGGKHAPIIAKTVKKYQRRITLITNTHQSPAEKVLDKEMDQTYIFPKQREPYTYNTSTYMSMILGRGGEEPKKIYEYITKKIDRIKLPDFETYDKYYLIIPGKFGGIKRMLQVKFIELFGRRIARDVETIEYVKHATTVVPSEKELFITFGEKNKQYGEHRLDIPLPKEAGYATMMAISYYIIGKIQAQQNPYFKENIVEYTKKASELFKETIKPIVE